MSVRLPFPCGCARCLARRFALQALADRPSRRRPRGRLARWLRAALPSPGPDGSAKRAG